MYEGCDLYKKLLLHGIGTVELINYNYILLTIRCGFGVSDICATTYSLYNGQVHVK